MSGSRNFCQFYLVLSLFYSLKRGSNGFIAEKTILILFQGSRGGPLFSRGSVRTPYPPLDPHMGNVIIMWQYLSQSGL